MTHDYTRHGTTSLFAALEVASGKVHGRCLRERRCHSVKSAFVRGTRYEALLSGVGFWTKRSRELRPSIFMRATPDHRIARRIERYAITYSWTDWL